METFIIFLLTLLVLGLIYQVTKSKAKIKYLQKDNITLGGIINKATLKTTEINKQFNLLEHTYVTVVSERNDLEEYLKAFINARFKVYVNSNFHSNYNLYNGKFYAKVSAANSSRSKAEGIPVLPLQDNKYSVIDVYKVRKLQKANPEGSILAYIEQAKTLKENLIQELGNKNLTPYSK